MIDRAKGVLMTMKNFNEEDAYALLRKTARAARPVNDQR